MFGLGVPLIRPLPRESKALRNIARLLASLKRVGVIDYDMLKMARRSEVDRWRDKMIGLYEEK
jgi:hypothetical protein